ncbi:CPBP family intramembrane metalloprotease [Thalassotalea euphylliae]|uniref:CPBP family intramembrane metalloprotease n=1 Tax=Thalassotalea euphylliae TaxID=1655234 RepID=A0A3E0TNN9_9GAMM|nr:CPBP family intramembrane glutamic endopeptidase [Thalassotalea euphylliae]REL25890.1 CPBP family intramembrane metalloprotease [Thalassotalea euphylliae]
MKPSSLNRHSSLKYWLELTCLFVLLPLLLWQFNHFISALVLPILSLVGAICLWLLIKDRRFKRFRLTNRLGFNRRFGATMVFFFGLMLSSTLAVAILAPESLFQLPLNWPDTWLLLLLLYPLFSALPQEVIFRTFLFHRYKTILPRKQHRIWLSSTSFGFAHIIYGNWVAVLLSTVAGYCFSQTYAVSRSTLLVALEHSLWGVWLFTLGLGHYFELQA